MRIIVLKKNKLVAIGTSILLTSAIVAGCSSNSGTNTEEPERMALKKRCTQYLKWHDTWIS